MDKTTKDWIKIIDSGRAFSKVQSVVAMEHLKNVSHNCFFRILRNHTSCQDKVLEAGCGSAFFSFSLALRGIEVTALDISDKLIRQLIQIQNSFFHKDLSKLEFVVGSILELDLLKKRYNIVFNHGVYEHWLSYDDRQLVLKNVKSVLSKNGKFIVAVPNLGNPLFNTALSKTEVPAMYIFSPAELRHELQESGLKVIEQGYLFVSPGFEQWVRYEWMTSMIKIIEKAYTQFPYLIKKIFSAHIYAVAIKL